MEKFNSIWNNLIRCVISTSHPCRQVIIEPTRMCSNYTGSWQHISSWIIWYNTQRVKLTLFIFYVYSLSSLLLQEALIFDVLPCCLLMRYSFTLCEIPRIICYLTLPSLLSHFTLFSTLQSINRFNFSTHKTIFFPLRCCECEKFHLQALQLHCVRVEKEEKSENCWGCLWKSSFEFIITSRFKRNKKKISSYDKNLACILGVSQYPTAGTGYN